MSEILLKDTIDVIKFVRSFSNLGLLDSKVLVEFWAKCVGLNISFHCEDFGEIRLLCKMAGKVLSGEWEFDSIKESFYHTRKTITVDDIRELNKW